MAGTKIMKAIYKHSVSNTMSQFSGVFSLSLGCCIRTYSRSHDKQAVGHEMLPYWWLSKGDGTRNKIWKRGNNPSCKPIYVWYNGAKCCKLNVEI